MEENGQPDALAVPNLVGRRRRVLIWERQPHPIPYVVFAFRLPAGVRYHITYGWVQGNPAPIGEFLRPHLYGRLNRFIEVLPQVAGAKVLPSKDTQMYRLRQDVGDWDWEKQRVHILIGGEVVSLLDVYLRRELMFVFVDQDCPVVVRGAYDSD